MLKAICLAAAVAVTGGAASAATVVSAVYGGTVTQIYDTGIFESQGSILNGSTFALIFTYDLAAGSVVSGTGDLAESHAGNFFWDIYAPADFQYQTFIGPGSVELVMNAVSLSYDFLYIAVLQGCSLSLNYCRQLIAAQSSLLSDDETTVYFRGAYLEGVQDFGDIPVDLATPFARVGGGFGATFDFTDIPYTPDISRTSVPETYVVAATGVSGTLNVRSATVSVAAGPVPLPVPLPGSLGLALSAFIGLGALKARFRRAKA